MTTLPLHLKYWRQQRALTQRALAELVTQHTGTPFSSKQISHYEHHIYNVPLHKALLLAKVLRVTVEQLVYGEEVPV